MLFKKYGLIALLLYSNSITAQQLKLEEFMKGNGFVGTSPENIQWTIDNSSILFDWNPQQELGSSKYLYSRSGKKIMNIPLEEGKYNTKPTIQSFEKRFPIHYYNENGNLVRYTIKTKTKTIVYSGKEPVGAIFRTNSADLIFFELGPDVMLYDASNGTIQQVTQFVQGKPTSETEKDTSFLAKQQEELFPFLQLQAQKQAFYKANTTKRRLPAPIYFEKNERVQGVSVSSDGRFISFTLHQDPDDAPTNYESFITGDGYTQRRFARSKVSNNDPKEHMGIYDRENDTVYFVSFSSLTNIRKKPSYFKEYGDQINEYENDRNIAIHQAIMNENGVAALVDVRSYDNKDRWIVLVNLETGTFQELENQHDEAWIGGPGISGWNEDAGTLQWVDTTTFYFQSEETGYSHLYTYNCATRQKKAITSGKWEVYEAFLSQNKENLYFIANKIHPGVRNGYVYNFKDTLFTPIFEGNFGIEWALSPDEKTWALRYSTTTAPWELYIAPNEKGSTIFRITDSQLPAFKTITLKTPEIIAIPTSDGKQVYARLYKPEKSNGAAVFFVHGAGYLQNAHYYWSYYQREMLFHQLLSQKGYTVLDVDYRASEGYGKDWRTDIYRHMGERDLLDFIDSKKYIVQNLGIDSNRIGIYGGSYGGFITLMAMLKTPNSFACGAALRSVTDWAHYNHEYTSNILNYPGTDPIAYKQSSPIYFANGLKSPLLLLHGMVDDNVQFQDIIRLNQRFIELGKTNYQLAVFPTEAHGFTYTPAWIDEYRRILELFETHLK